MILRAYYMDKEVFLTAPDTGLVFDGTSFVSPAEAKWVALKYFTEVQASAPVSYPVQYPSEISTLNWKNFWVCKVLGVESEAPVSGPTDVNGITDPTNGECLCGITCIGTQIQNVIVQNKV